MANTNVSTSLALRAAIQAALSNDIITLQGITPASEPNGYSVLTLAKRSSFVPAATPFSGYTVQGASTTLASSALLVDTLIYQENVDGANAAGTVKNLTLNYVANGAADGGALLSVTSSASRNIILDNIKITGVHKGWNGNGNLYMSLRSFNAAAPLNTSLTMTGVTVDATGQNNSFNGTTGGSAFLHSWNNAGTVSISGSLFDEKGFASTLNLLNFSTNLGSYSITNNTFFRSVNQTVRPEGNRLQNVTATLTSNTFSDGSYLDLYGNVANITLNTNTFNTIANGYGIRVTASGVSGTPTLTGTNVFTGPGLPLKYVNATANTSYTLTGTVTVNGPSFSNLIAGGQGADTISGSSNADWINGDDGADSISGLAGDDSLLGGGGNDSLLGGAGDDSLLGGAGDDSLLGGAGDDSLVGGGGDDSLLGGAGDDSLLGGAGNDSLIGGLGADTLTGGLGNDRFQWLSGDGTDTITDFTTANDQFALADVFTNTAPGNTLLATDYLTFATFASIPSGGSAPDDKVIEITGSQTAAQINNNIPGLSNTYVLVFNSTVGNAQLIFDGNWANAAGRQVVANLTSINSLALTNAFTNTDFFVV